MVESESRLTMPQLLDHPWLKEAVSKARAEVEVARAAKASAPASKPQQQPSASDAKGGASSAPAMRIADAKGEPPTIAPKVQAVGSKKGVAACCLIS